MNEALLQHTLFVPRVEVHVLSSERISRATVGCIVKCKESLTAKKCSVEDRDCNLCCMTDHVLPLPMLVFALFGVLCSIPAGQESYSQPSSRCQKVRNHQTFPGVFGRSDCLPFSIQSRRFPSLALKIDSSWVAGTRGF